MEDEPLISEIVAECLADRGFAVTALDTADDAGAVLESGSHFDALVTDIKFPGRTSGWELARAARMRFRSIAVVYTTGHGETEWLREGVPHSILMPTPFVPDLLAARVEELLAAAAPASE